MSDVSEKNASATPRVETADQPGRKPAQLQGFVAAVPWISLFILVALVVAAFGKAFWFGYVEQDFSRVVGNPIAHDRRELVNLLRPDFARQQVPDAGRPTLLATEMIERWVWGMRPAGRHLTNLACHLAVTLLLFLGLRRLAGPRPQNALGWPLLVAALFAVHPLALEPAVVINKREDALALFFGMIGVGGLWFARGRGLWLHRWGARLFAFVAIALAAFAKEAAYCLPLMVVLIDMWPLPASASTVPSYRHRLRLVDWILVSVAVAIPFCWRAWVFGAPGIADLTSPLDTAPLWTRLSEGFAGLAVGFVHALVPSNLAGEYGAGIGTGFWAVLMRMALLGGLGLGAVLAVWGARKHPWPGFGLFWAVLAYVPVMGWFPMVVARADRYLYWSLPGILIFWVTGARALLTQLDLWLDDKSASKRIRAASVGLAVVLVGGLVWLSSESATKWSRQADYTLARLKLQPTSPQAWAAFAQQQLNTRDTVGANGTAGQAVRMAPWDDEIRELYGLTLLEQGQINAAVGQLEEARKLAPRTPRFSILSNLGYCYRRMGRDGEAEKALREAIALAPWDDRAWLNLAGMAQTRGDLKEAKRLLRTFLDGPGRDSRDAKELLHRYSRGPR